MILSPPPLFFSLYIYIYTLPPSKKKENAKFTPTCPHGNISAFIPKGRPDTGAHPVNSPCGCLTKLQDKPEQQHLRVTRSDLPMLLSAPLLRGLLG